MSKLIKLKQKYPNQWLIIRPTAHDEFGQITEGELLAHAPTREGLQQYLDKIKAQEDHTAFCYTGRADTPMI